MPIISRFYGISILMYFLDHNPPHLHVKYSGFEAVYSLSGSKLAGYIPLRAESLVLQWLDERQTDLQDNWTRAVRGEPLLYIQPLE